MRFKVEVSEDLRARSQEQAGPQEQAVKPRWELVVGLDPSLDPHPDPSLSCPKAAPERVLAVDKAELFVGRHDEQRDVKPEISLYDPGASRRHAKFVYEPDGGLWLQDLDSTNGSRINGKDVPPGKRLRLVEGDEVTLGRWTRIKVRGQR